MRTRFVDLIRGWTVLACKRDYVEGDDRVKESDPDFEKRNSTWDIWPIEEDSLIYGVISQWYEKNPDPSIKICYAGRPLLSPKRLHQFRHGR